MGFTDDLGRIGSACRLFSHLTLVISEKHVLRGHVNKVTREKTYHGRAHRQSVTGTIAISWRQRRMGGGRQ